VCDFLASTHPYATSSRAHTRVALLCEQCMRANLTRHSRHFASTHPCATTSRAHTRVPLLSKQCMRANLTRHQHHPPSAHHSSMRLQPPQPARCGGANRSRQGPRQNRQAWRVRFRSGGAKGCGHGWSGATAQPADAKPVETRSAYSSARRHPAEPRPSGSGSSFPELPLPHGRGSA